eukprot:9172384-Alexandrium_andersonii.AAC.1
MSSSLRPCASSVLPEAIAAGSQSGGGRQRRVGPPSPLPPHADASVAGFAPPPATLPVCRCCCCSSLPARRGGWRPQQQHQQQTPAANSCQQPQSGGRSPGASCSACAAWRSAGAHPPRSKGGAGQVVEGCMHGGGGGCRARVWNWGDRPSSGGRGAD